MRALAVLAAALVALPAPAVVARIATGRAPCDAVAAFGAVWVANDGSGTLTRVDPRTNRITRRVKVGTGACAIAAGAGALWVARYSSGTVLRVDPRTLRARAVRVGGEPGDLLFADGHVWASAWSGGRVVAIDPRTLAVVRRVEVGGFPTALAFRAGGVWVGFGRDATAVARIDPESGAVERLEVGVRQPSTFVAGTPGVLWIVANDHEILRLDPRTRTLTARLHAGRTLSAGAAAPGGMVWIPDKEQNVVYRVDPRSNRLVDSFAAGRGAYKALRAYGSMWVTSYAGADVWRFRP